MGIQALNADTPDVGDLFEKEEDIDDDMLWRIAGSIDERLQRRNRYAVAKRANWIVPGHGPMFRVSDAMRAKLRRDATEESHSLDVAAGAAQSADAAVKRFIDEQCDKEVALAAVAVRCRDSEQFDVTGDEDTVLERNPQLEDISEERQHCKKNG